MPKKQCDKRRYTMGRAWEDDGGALYPGDLED